MKVHYSYESTLSDYIIS